MGGGGHDHPQPPGGEAIAMPEVVRPATGKKQCFPALLGDDLCSLVTGTSSACSFLKYTSAELGTYTGKNC